MSDMHNEYFDNLDPIEDLADSVTDLVEKLVRIHQNLEIHQYKLLKDDAEAYQRQETVNPQAILQWQNFISRVVAELDTLIMPL